MSTFDINVTGRRGIHEKLAQNDDPFNCPADQTVVIEVENSVPVDTKLAFTEGQYVAPAVVQAPAPTPTPEPEAEDDAAPEEEAED